MDPRSYIEESIFRTRDSQTTHGVIESELFFGLNKKILKQRLIQVRNWHQVSLLHGFSPTYTARNPFGAEVALLIPTTERPRFFFALNKPLTKAIFFFWNSWSLKFLKWRKIDQRKGFKFLIASCCWWYEDGCSILGHYIYDLSSVSRDIQGHSFTWFCHFRFLILYYVRKCGMCSCFFIFKKRTMWLILNSHRYFFFYKNKFMWGHEVAHQQNKESLSLIKLFSIISRKRITWQCYWRNYVA